MTKRWRVVDHNGETVFEADAIHKEPAVVGGLVTAGAWAKKLAKETTDPEAPTPMKAVKDAQ